ncbi:MAG: hypothetical protein QF886_01440, partial [Planctomycetota bacterium]|nr:hypothetical protein [Planctomycetota bacterium]
MGSEQFAGAAAPNDPGTQRGIQSVPAPKALTVRAVLLSAISVIVFTVAGNVSVLHRYEIIGTGYLPRGVVFYLLFLILYNQTIGRLLPWVRLQRVEVMVVFCALLAMDSIPAQDFAQHFYLNIAGMVQYTGEDSPVAHLNIREHFMPGMLPATDPSAPVIKWLYSTIPEGAGVPYKAWLKTFLIWTPYIFLLYWLLLWCAALISYRWEQEERLLFPMMQIPLEVADTSDGKPSAIMKSKLMWVFFALTSAVYTLNFLSAYFPDVPAVPLSTNLGRMAHGGPLSAFNWIRLDFRPEMIGISYLLASEVGFSLVFFYFLRRVIIMLRIFYGLPTAHSTFLQFQAGGGFIVLGFALLWAARGYLKGCAHQAVRGGPEANFYRLCFFGIVTGFGGVVGWCWAVGISVKWATVQFGVFVLASLVASRVICEAGMFLYSSPLFGLGTVLFSGFSAQMAQKEITLLTATTWTDVRNSSAMAMPYMMQTFKVGSSVGLKRSHTAFLIFGAIVLSVLACHVAVPYIIYHTGVGNLAPWPSRSGQNTVRRLAHFLSHPTSMDSEKWTAFLSGGGIIGLLVALRQNFFWWPLHPLGFVVSLWGWPIDRYWLSIFLGWMLKALVCRYGGYKTYRIVRPAA